MSANSILPSETQADKTPAADSTAVVPAESVATRLFLRPWKHMLEHRGVPTLVYLAKTEAHTYAFSVAANAILSFFPFMVLLMWLIRNVFHSETMFNVVVDLLKDHLPAGQDFVIKNLTYLVNQIISLVLAFACGILALASVGMAAGNELALSFIMRGNENIVFRAATFVALKICATAASITIFFLIYWILPNGKVK